MAGHTSTPEPIRLVPPTLEPETDEPATDSAPEGAMAPTGDSEGSPDGAGETGGAPDSEGTAAPADAAPAEEDPMVKLARFKQMLDAGLITQADYDAAKNKVLGL